MVNKKRLAGIGVAIGLFYLFGAVIGLFTVAFTGIGMNEPFTKLVTGPTPIHVGDEVLAPFGVAPTDIGLAPNTAIVLPAVPAVIRMFGFTLSFEGFTIADVFGGGGGIVGFVVGSYYYIVFAYQDYKES